jgi:endonuclease III
MIERTVPALTKVLETLEEHYGPQEPNWPTDPYRFLVWWHCGYPASDAACAKGWEALRREIGTDPETLLAASPAQLTSALKAGGMVPEIRARRLQEIAEKVLSAFGGDLSGALRAMPVEKAIAALKRFPNIAEPGAARILLFARIAPVIAVPSNCPQVLVRIQHGRERESYNVTYREAERAIEAGLPAQFDARIRAYLLLKKHGQELCKRTNPRCGQCPVAAECAFAAGKDRGVPVTTRKAAHLPAKRRPA